MSDLTRLNVNMNAETAAALKFYAAQHGVSLTEAIRRCIAVTSFIDKEQRDGRTIFIEGPNGRKRREMVMM